ncbi:MAG: thioesterase family protein [bacterium]|nr:acyl-CoA thioesterase [candidate division KSB1 bacterium]MDH7559136.1 thioesterase family protein [bacterium]
MHSPLVARLKVRSYELDSFGHVNNANFLHYLEFARGEFMALRGMGFADFTRWQARPVVVRACIDFRTPAFADDLLRIQGAITSWGRARFTLSYVIYNETRRRLCAEAETVMAFVNIAGRPVAIPQAFREAFADGTRKE